MPELRQRIRHTVDYSLILGAIERCCENANRDGFRDVNPVYNAAGPWGSTMSITLVTEIKSVEDQPSGASPDRENPERSLELAIAAAQTAADNGGTEIVVLDMSKQSAMFDYFVIATGTSRRQLHAMSEEIDHKLEDELNDRRMNIDGYDESRWIVLDYGTVIIHLFDNDTRAFYSLESLWADAMPVDLSEKIRI